MTAIIGSLTENKNLRLLGARISQSQSDEIKFMRQWLEVKGEAVSLPMPAMASMAHGTHASGHQMLMPGILLRSSWTLGEKQRAMSLTVCF
jgi:uncharacterized protein (DUF305 family)